MLAVVVCCVGDLLRLLWHFASVMFFLWVEIYGLVVIFQKIKTKIENVGIEKKREKKGK